MSAYFLVEIETVDAQAMAEYRALIPPVVQAFGGRFLVRGGACETLEGDWVPPRLVVLEFPDLATARAFYDSELYAPLKQLRLRAGRSRLVLVEGVP
ncbi:MAG: DUF1330 domain-containing protein [Betaproteobacteria bacterium]|nr:DUF1330 domain-containing protein [Betaproteobacteria bacterium]